MANLPDDEAYLSDYTQTEDFAHVKSPFAVDPDSGPSDVWRWAHQNDTCARFVNDDSKMVLREFGYVMWDRTRLDGWNIFVTPWEVLDTVASTDDRTQRWAEMQISFDQRSKLYMAGGRGWWRLGDESKVTWLHGKSPSDVRFFRQTTRRVESIDEARDLIRSLTIPRKIHAY